MSVCLFVQSVCDVRIGYCDQTVLRIKMKLGTEVGLGPGHIGFDGAQAPKEHSPNFRPMSVVRGQMAGQIN